MPDIMEEERGKVVHTKEPARSLRENGAGNKKAYLII